MTIKLSSFAHIKSVDGRFRPSFKNLSACKQEEFFLYLYNKGIRYVSRVSYHYEDDGREIDDGELFSLIKDWLASDLEIDSKYENDINTKDVLNAMCEDHFPNMTRIAERVLKTGHIGYDSNYKVDGVITRKNAEIKYLISALEEKDRIMNEKDLIIESLRK